MKIMKLEKYIECLNKQNIPPDTIKEHKDIITDFIRYFKVFESKKASSIAEKEIAIRYSRKLKNKKTNTLKNFSALCDYLKWIEYIKLYIAFIEIMDCHNALEVLSDKIKDKYGGELHDFIFHVGLPPLGADEKERLAFTTKIMKRMEQTISYKEIKNTWFQVQHGIPEDYWKKSDMADREKYKKCKNTDEFLNLKRHERDVMLTSLRNEGKLWYTMIINDKVLEFIKSDPEMEVGKREGNRIYITKVPYNASRYLNEKNNKLKRYYACHCPLVREAILQDHPISPDICNCSLGHASHYLAGLDQVFKGEVLESAIKGDIRCRFVFYLQDKKC